MNLIGQFFFQFVHRASRLGNVSLFTQHNTYTVQKLFHSAKSGLCLFGHAWVSAQRNKKPLPFTHCKVKHSPKLPLSKEIKITQFCEILSFSSKGSFSPLIFLWCVHFYTLTAESDHLF